MNTEVWYLPYFEGVNHTRMINNETFANANANANARIVHTMIQISTSSAGASAQLSCQHCFCSTLSLLPILLPSRRLASSAQEFCCYHSLLQQARRSSPLRFASIHLFIQSIPSIQKFKTLPLSRGHQVRKHVLLPTTLRQHGSIKPPPLFFIGSRVFNLIYKEESIEKVNIAAFFSL